ncbi:GntR family transcriptional regulator [Saccharopolyspora lacisalsi]|uniref:GntR family transcriptional regulator n=1 Tax=Halosaccharopolyspora lacisalsi TaxID=1000566 RepID=A0A839E3I1_9PSEU|nr:GntR family transcriptional regulator [Halosaccharopolyspora lacisalsi]MBA8827843.1 GntR family transcriptional regulator [Halosaccharopolyspora lacisalsi]
MRKEDQFLDRMRSELDAGTYPPGTVLPTQRELAEQYGHDVREIRAAMQRLEAAGLVRIRRKAGTVVLDPQPVKRMGVERYARHRWMQGVAPFEADMSAGNGGASVTVDQRNTVETVAASADVAAGLDIGEGEAVVRRYRKLYDAAGQPTHYVTSWYRVNDVIGTAIMSTDPGTAGQGGGFSVLHQQGLTPHTIREDLNIREPSPAETDELDIPPTLLVTEMWRWVRTAAGRPVEYAYGVHNALKFQWSYTFEAPE